MSTTSSSPAMWRRCWIFWPRPSRTIFLGGIWVAARACDEPPQIQLLDIVGTGNFVVSIERFTARRGAKVLAQEVCVVWRMENDRCVEMWAHFSDQAACDAFWADSP